MKIFLAYFLLVLLILSEAIFIVLSLQFVHAGNRKIHASQAKANSQSTQIKNVLTTKNTVSLKPATYSLKNYQVPILMYHRVSDTQITSNFYSEGLTVTPKDFEDQMNFLKENSYQTISLLDLYQSFYFKKPLPKKSVILTFDDGYSDSYTTILPVLKEYHFRGTFFVTNDRLGHPYYLSKSEVAILAASGMEIGSHTQDHSDLTTLSDQGLTKEIDWAKINLESIIQKPIYVFSYPAGEYNPKVEEKVVSAGYLMAVTTDAGKVQSNQKPLELKRVRIVPGLTLLEFARLLN